MQKVKETPSEQSARLVGTPEGAALLRLIDSYPSKLELARALGSSAEYVSRCIREGKLSRSGAMVADQKGLAKKEDLRPDVTDWSAVPAGLPVGVKPDRSGPNQLLLRDLAAHFGSVRKFCKASGVSIRNFHDWLSRDAISSQGVLKLVAMKGLSRELRARVKAMVDTKSAGG